MKGGRGSLYPFVQFSREHWASLPMDDSFSLSEKDVRGLGAHLSQEEATQVYLPLSRLLYLHVSATQGLAREPPGRAGEHRRLSVPQ
jgi:type I pantothenate kinase